MSEGTINTAEQSEKLNNSQHTVAFEGIGEAVSQEEASLGPWSRSRALRIIVWVLMLQVVIVLAICASALLSGFASVVEMIDWLRASWGI